MYKRQAFGSIFNTYAGLYLPKDNDLLLSMPVPVSSLVAARLSGVYLMGLMLSLIHILMFDLCVGSGYGRFKIANFLSEMGIKTRDGKNWYEATVGHILHNIMYTGVLRSGSTQSKAFPDVYKRQILHTASRLFVYRFCCASLLSRRKLIFAN